jgi:PPOX class probable F420-dependent enzyme
VTPEDARRRFAAARVARLATIGAGGSPHLVPIVFAADGDTVYTAVDAKPKRTRALKRLANVRRDPHVTLLADHYEEDWSALWWVRADGRAAIVDATDAADALALLTARYEPYREQPPAGPVLVITVDRWTGWSAS